MDDQRLIKGQRPALSHRATENRFGGRPGPAKPRESYYRCIEAETRLQEALNELVDIKYRIIRAQQSMRITQELLRMREGDQFLIDTLHYIRQKMRRLVQRRVSILSRIPGLRQRVREACAENIRRPALARRT